MLGEASYSVKRTTSGQIIEHQLNFASHGCMDIPHYYSKKSRTCILNQPHCIIVLRTLWFKASKSASKLVSQVQLKRSGSEIKSLGILSSK